MTYELRKVWHTTNTTYSTCGPDILVIVPEPGYKDNVALARANAQWQQNWARNLGRKCGLVVVMSNVIAQDAETREAYSETILPDLCFGAALVAGNPLSIAIGSFLVGRSTPELPVRLVGSIDEGIAWLESIRNQ